MFKFLNSFFSSSDKQIDESLKQLIDKSIDLTVKGTDPRLSQVSGHKKKFQDSIKHALLYIDNIIEQMHPPLEISRQQYAANPQVNAFFGTANDIKDLFQHNRDVSKYMYKSISDDEFIYLGMAMSLTTRNVLARKQVSGIIKKDVKRTAVSFSEHRLVDPCDSEVELRRKIKERVFMTLIQASLVKLIGIKDQKHELEEQRSLLMAKLRNYKKQALGLETGINPSTYENFSFKKLNSELSEIEANLKHISTNIVTLDQYIDVINEVMDNPSNYLKAENSSIRMTRMNFTATLNDEDPGEEIVFTDFQANQNKVIGRLVKISQNELR